MSLRAETKVFAVLMTFLNMSVRQLKALATQVVYIDDKISRRFELWRASKVVAVHPHLKEKIRGDTNSGVCCGARAEIIVTARLTCRATT